MISIVMPAYNAAKYIRRAIDSVLSQTFNDWELIVVDDGSNDDTPTIISEYSQKDSRIISFRLDNTGSAKIPRDCAIYHAKNQHVLFLDADDYLERHYLQKVWKRHIDANADVVLGKMCILDSKSMTIEKILPLAKFDDKKIYEGKSLVKDTLQAWRIGFNGALIDKKFLQDRLSYPNSGIQAWMNSDEVDSRCVLLGNPIVAFADAIYYYWHNTLSVSNKLSIKQFHYLITEMELHNLISDKFGTGSDEIRLMVKQHQAVIRRSVQLMVLNPNFLKKEEAAAWVCNNLSKLIELTYKDLLLQRLIYKLYRVRYKLLFLLTKTGVTRIFKKTRSLFLNAEDNAFNVIRREREKFIRLHLAPHYKGDSTQEKQTVKPYVISVFNGFVESGGLADRLRGLVSTYIAAKKANREYKILFTSPFDLSLFLVPNKIDWKISETEIAFNEKQSNIVVLDSVLNTKKHALRQKKWLASKVCESNDKQVHVYTNAFYSYYDNYSEFFNDLFRPSDRLQESIARQLEMLGNNYVSVSLRFLNLFNDFNETHGLPSEKYTEDFKAQIRYSCLNEIKNIHQKHPGVKILVNSDSSSFLSYASELEYVYVIPGTITHIDTEKEGSYEAYEKTFLDFFMIANASYIYLLQTPPMHLSGYPYAASFIYQRSFEIIKF